MSIYDTDNQKEIEDREIEKSRIRIFFELLLRKLWNLCKVNMLHIITSIPMLVLIAIIMGVFSQMATNAMLPFVAEQMGIGVADLGNPELALPAFAIDICTRLILTLWFFNFFGAGPTTAGVTYILRNYTREEAVFLLSDWWENTRDNFKQASVVFIIDILVFCSCMMAIIFYFNQNIILTIFIIYALIVYLLLRMYLYQVMITFKCSVKNLFRNSFTLLVQNLPKSLLLLVVIMIIHVAIPCVGIWMDFDVIVWSIFILLELVVLPTVTSFMVNFFIYPIFERHINNKEVLNG